MQAVNKLYVIGIGYKPLISKAREIIRRADKILASVRLLEVFKNYDEYEEAKDRILVFNNIEDTLDFISDNSKSLKIVLLSSGDPMFFGIGRKAVNKFGKDAVEILPDLSSIQMAFAKIKEPWDNAFLMSLHGGPDPKKRRRLEHEINEIPSLLLEHSKIAILTDKENNPSAIANEIIMSSALGSQLSALSIFVCERLGYPDEKIISGTPEEIAGKSFSQPNVVIVIKTEDRSHQQEALKRKSEVRFGLTEKEIQHSRGLITKDEIRAVAVHKLRLPQKGVFWDIGAGSGSVSIEAARLCSGLNVFAVEKEDEQLDNIRENMTRFQALNIKITKGAAPDILKDLPFPDRVFIGGSGGRIGEIIEFIAKTQAGIIVINATTIETLNKATAGLKKAGFEIDVTQVSVSRTKDIGDSQYLSALNPVFIIKGVRV